MTKIEFIQDDLVSWYLLFLPLGLEGADRLYSAFGLVVTPEQAVEIRNVAREFALNKYPNRSTPEDNISILRWTFDEFSRRTDESTSLKVYIWAKQTHYLRQEETAPLYVWDLTLRRLAGIYGMRYDLAEIEIEKNSLGKLIDVVKSEIRHRDTFLDTISKMREKEVTPVNEPILEKYVEDTSPYNTLEELVMSNSLKNILREIKEIVTDEDMKLVIEWCKDQAKIMRFPQEMIDPIEAFV